MDICVKWRQAGQICSGEMGTNWYSWRIESQKEVTVGDSYMTLFDHPYQNTIWMVLDVCLAVQWELLFHVLFLSVFFSSYLFVYGVVFCTRLLLLAADSGLSLGPQAIISMIKNKDKETKNSEFICMLLNFIYTKFALQKTLHLTFCVVYIHHFWKDPGVMAD